MGLKQFSPYIVLLFGITAVALSFVSSFWCQTIAFEPSSDLFPTVSFGIWRQKQTEFFVVSDSDSSTLVVTNKCVKYDGGVDIDSKWKAARAFSILAPIIGLLLVVGICGRPSAPVWKLSGILLMTIVTLFQGLTLLFLKSAACQSIPLASEVSDVNRALVDSAYPDDCVMDAGSKMSVSTVVFWFVTGLIMVALGPPEEDGKE